MVSVEMFEHMSNWTALLRRVRSWLEDDGLLFIHIFTHRSAPYRFDETEMPNWIAHHFFTGGILLRTGNPATLHIAMTTRSRTPMEIDIGIKSRKDRKADRRVGSAILLADSYTLTLKTHNFHWNVTGPLFNTLHLMFEAEYTEWRPPSI